MAIAFAVIGVALAAFCIWLTVRIVNRRERWAQWTGVVLVVLTAYPVSFGPACWISSHLRYGQDLVPVVYGRLLPTMKIGERNPLAEGGTGMPDGLLERFSITPEDGLASYARLASASGWRWRYCAVYAFWRNGKPGAKFVRLREENWEWSNRP